jgi:hypothetical protein
MANKSHATKLINLVLGSGAELFHSPEGDLYVTVPIGETNETLSLTERPFRNWLARAYFVATKSGVSGSALADAVMALSGMAHASGLTYPIYTRVASLDACVYLDLCRDDRQALIITASGWSIGMAPPTVRFIRRIGALPLPNPVRGRPLADLLPTVINVSQDGLILLTAWLIGCLRGLKPYPILIITGEYGTGKSYASRTCRQLIDPSQANLSLTPKEPRDLIIAARNSHILGFDNLSYIPDWLSDALCAIATGAGFRTRALTTDSTEMIFSSANPIVLNSIVDIVRRGDLMDRGITIKLDPIPDAKRRTEADMDAAFRAAQPEILGGLASALVYALRAPIKLSRLPRMADFATTVESAAPALGWVTNAFLRAYDENRANAAATMVDGDVVIDALNKLRDLQQLQAGVRAWSGSSRELFDGLTTLTSDDAHGFPKTPQALIGYLRRLAPSLRALNVEVQEPKVARNEDGKPERSMKVTWTEKGPKQTVIQFPKDSAQGG